MSATVAPIADESPREWGFSPLPVRKFHIGLYATRTGKRADKQCVVLYLGNDCDWSEIQRQRNGNPSWAHLASAEETDAAREYRESGKRAMSLKYSGQAPADLTGMAADLSCLGYPPETVTRFLEKARPYFPTPA